MSSVALPDGLLSKEPCAALPQHTRAHLALPVPQLPLVLFLCFSKNKTAKKKVLCMSCNWVLKFSSGQRVLHSL